MTIERACVRRKIAGQNGHGPRGRRLVGEADGQVEVGGGACLHADGRCRGSNRGTFEGDCNDEGDKNCPKGRSAPEDSEACGMQWDDLWGSVPDRSAPINTSSLTCRVASQVI